MLQSKNSTHYSKDKIKFEFALERARSTRNKNRKV